MSILDVENMDKYYDKDDDSGMLQIHKNLPKHGKHGIIVGSTGSGKSNIMTDMICRNKIVYDRLYVLSRHIHQPAYKYIKKYIEGLENKIKKRFNLNSNIIQLWTDDISELPAIEDMDAEYRNVLIIDDFAVIPKLLMGKIVDYYTRARHSNCSCWFLGQLYFNIPRGVRMNCHYIILFNNNNSREISSLERELSNLDKGMFRKIYNYALDKKYNFLFIDNLASDSKSRFRKGFKEVIDLNSL